MRLGIILGCLAAVCVAGSLRATITVPPNAEAVLVVTGDQHSAYARTAQWVGLIEYLRKSQPDLPLAVLIDGDSLVGGNAVARESQGQIDFAMMTALARRVPLIVNVGNHETEFDSMGETVRRIAATGAWVVSNIRSAGGDRAWAPASVTFSLGKHQVVVAGIATDDLSTYRQEVRDTLDIPQPVAWAQSRLPDLLQAAPIRVVLSHAGLQADREILKTVPDGTLFAGAHNHLRFIQPMGRTMYFQSGSWNECATLAWLCVGPDGKPTWVLQQVPLSRDDPADPELAKLIEETRAKYLTDADRAVVGQTDHAWSRAEAARWVAGVMAQGAGAVAGFVGNTTFGDGLPEGVVTRADLDACVRFDGPVYVAAVTGERLQQLLAAANQGPETPFAERTGEFSYATGPDSIVPEGHYQIATTDWGAKHTERYFGEPALDWQPAEPEVKLKALVEATLQNLPVGSDPEDEPSLVSMDHVDDLLALGQQMFDLFAPAEVKADYEFPTRERWEAIAGRLQAALEGGSLENLAQFEPQARQALAVLDSLEGGEVYATWLRERIDYIEAAKAVTESPSVPETKGSEDIPHYELWVKRLEKRPVPPGATRWLPVVQPLFAAEGVPVALAWLAETESTFDPKAESPVGARGLFQLMPATAKDLGLSTHWPDERTDPEKSARAAAKYLRWLHGKFNNWPLALAAYNAGPGRVQRLLTKHQATTFAEIADHLPAETRLYVPKVLATLQVRAGKRL